MTELRADDLPEATPESQGMRSDRLREMAEYVRGEGLDVRSLVIVRNGRLVLEWYAGGVTRDHNHNLYSITKSVVATLAGIAIAEGVLPGPKATIGEMLPGSGGRPGVGAIKLADLLTMRSGFPVARANRPTGPERELFDRLNRASERTRFALEELSLVRKPGDVFAYNNVDPQVVLAAIEKGSRDRIFEFADEKLFVSLGFENAVWKFLDKTGQVPGGYGLRLRAIDLAKLGLLHLARGSWNGRELLPEDWVGSATRDQTGTGYGYYWWIDAGTGSYSAKGVRGQRLHVVPGQNLLFVMTAELPPARTPSITKKMFEEFVLDAVAGDAPLPENTEARRGLFEEIEKGTDYLPASRSGLPPLRLPQ